MGRPNSRNNANTSTRPDFFEPISQLSNDIVPTPSPRTLDPFAHSKENKENIKPLANRGPNTTNTDFNFNI